eukprot:CAMPEP_0175079754 /NCGR_PEP_ID=MMETSP0052_2-20121109/25022_1 /TAXON_ID=51329 ORGANISM="Polytomella parva, Strain SAG 63-3" /NCGR_SAMPLE_ID=MMETSP0052_2 /ASSEMBLY_ACC=CAM_ASM_000194 /LENGTH=310 /DNA_ID=CAMNT_0016350167 /DNA_START=99 /DNA_END=1028 /DNA_ORIENTATION=+
MRKIKKLFCLIVLIFLCLSILVRSDEITDEQQDLKDLEDNYLNLEDDSNGYYDDGESTPYQTYDGYSATDLMPTYGDYASTEDSLDVEDCVLNGTNIILSSHTSDCSLNVSGGNSQLANLEGGIDGNYELQSCYNGRPLYRRITSKAPEGDLVLFYSSLYGDWDFARSLGVDADVLVYGGDLVHFTTPLQVEDWQVLASLTLKPTAYGEDDFTLINLSVTCSNAKGQASNVSIVEVAGAQSVSAGLDHPLLTDEEIEAKYRYVYDKYGKSSNAGGSGNTPRNWLSVFFLLLIGIILIVTMPHLVKRSKKW